MEELTLMPLSFRDLYIIKVLAEFAKRYIATSELLKVELQYAEQESPTILPNELDSLIKRINEYKEELRNKYGS